MKSPKSNTGRSTINWLFAGVVGCALLTLIVWGGLNASVRTNLLNELPKLILELLLLIFFGGLLVNALLEKNRKLEEESRAKIAIQRSLLNDLIRAYNNTKRVRRRLRVKVKSSTARPLDLSKYPEEMESLNDAQLEFERILKELGTHQEYFKGDYEKLESNIEEIEDYLRQLYKEYEGRESKYTVAEFIAPSRGSRIKETLFRAFDETVETMRKNISGK